MMKKVLDLIAAYWQLIVASILMIVSLIATIVKTKKMKGDVFLSLKEKLLEQLPTWISLVECSGNGNEKKIQVLNDALVLSKDILGHKLSDQERDYIIAFCNKQIEAILGTPQKKLGMEVNKNVFKNRR